jgi:glucosylglycerate hydrolase
MSVTAGTGTTLRDRAAAVLHANDAGSWTRAAPVLYPHQWSWDSAFIAIGWAHLDARRAMTELESLFAAQWATGMVPHLVFRAGPDHPYFPGPEWWGTSVSPAAPAAPIKTADLAADTAGTATGNPRARAGALPADGQLAPLPRHPA